MPTLNSFHRALAVGLFGLATGGGVGGGPAASPVIESDGPLILPAGPDEVADTVILKSGKVFSNVKSFPAGGSHTIKFENGSSVSVPNAQIKIVRIKGVSWRQKTQQAVAAVAQKRQPRSQAPQRVVLPKEPIGREIQALQTDAEAETPEEEGFALGPVSKSILLPGWGQYSLGYKWRAAGTVALGIPIVQGYWVHRNEHTEAQRQYSETIGPYLLAQPQHTPWGLAVYYSLFAYRRQVLIAKENETNVMVYALMGLWSLQALDTYYLNSLAGGKDPFFHYAKKVGIIDPAHEGTTLLAFSDGRNFIIGFGVYF